MKRPQWCSTPPDLRRCGGIGRLPLHRRPPSLTVLAFPPIVPRHPGTPRRAVRRPLRYYYSPRRTMLSATESFPPDPNDSERDGRPESGLLRAFYLPLLLCTCCLHTARASGSPRPEGRRLSPRDLCSAAATESRARNPTGNKSFRRTLGPSP